MTASIHQKKVQYSSHNRKNLIENKWNVYSKLWPRIRVSLENTTGNTFCLDTDCDRPDLTTEGFRRCFSSSDCIALGNGTVYHQKCTTHIWAGVQTDSVNTHAASEDARLHTYAETRLHYSVEDIQLWSWDEHIPAAWRVAQRSDRFYF